MPKIYRKLPVEIEAELFTRNTWNKVELFTNNEATGFSIPKCIDGIATCTIPTLEGDHTAKEGDYIIKGVNGEFYPCKPDIFENTYEEVI